MSVRPRRPSPGRAALVGAARCAALLALGGLALLGRRDAAAQAPQPSPAPTRLLYSVTYQDPVANLRAPGGLSVAPDGDVYVADTGNDRVLAFAPNGSLRRSFGHHGDADGELNGPRDLAMDGSRVWLLDAGGLQRFAAGGQFEARLPVASCPAAPGGPSFPPGEPILDLARDGYLVVLHRVGAGCVQRYSPDGVLVAVWARPVTWHANEDSDLAVAADDSVYVYDHYYKASDELEGPRITHYAADGRELGAWGSLGDGPGEFAGAAVALDVAPDGTLWAAESTTGRVQHFSAEGQFLAEWPMTGHRQVDGLAVAPDGTLFTLTDAYHVAHWSPAGALLGEWAGGATEAKTGAFGLPTDMAVAADGSLFLALSNSARVRRFAPDGRYLGAWGKPGSDPGEFDRALAVAASPDGRVYIADTENHRVQAFDAAGKLLGVWGRAGTGDGEFQHPMWLAVGQEGRVYVADTGNQRVQYFTPDGAYLGQWRNLPTAGGLTDMQGLATASDGTVYVVDSQQLGGRQVARAQRFTAEGEPMASWRITPGAGWSLAARVAVAPDGTVYAGEALSGGLYRFTADGQPLGPVAAEGGIGAPPPGWNAFRFAADGSLYTADDRGRLMAFGPRAPGDWRVTWFDNPWLAGPSRAVTSAAEPVFDWASAAPGPELPAQGFSARVERNLVFPPGVYRFQVDHSAGARLWVGDSLLVDEPEGPPAEPVAGADLMLRPEGARRVRLEYSDAPGPAHVALSWQRVAAVYSVYLPRTAR